MARVGIDLGTTNSLLAMVYDDGPHVVPRGTGRIIPSVVHYRWDAGDDDVVVGEEADNLEDGLRVVRSIKRLMGRTYEEAEREGSREYFRPDGEDVRLVRRGDHDLGLEVRKPGREPRTFWPQEVSAHVLREARRHAETSLGRPVEGAVITVPAYFRDPHRAATLDAAREAGLEVAGGDLLDEPSAAALAFAPVVGFAPGEPVLVADWGGGTFDVTVQTSDGQGWYQNSIDGDLTAGGDDVDRAVVALALARGGLPPNLLREPVNRSRLLRAARAAKERLSEHESASLVCSKLRDPATGRKLPSLAVELDRAAFDEAIAPLLHRVRESLERCLRHPDVDRTSLRRVLLVGGSSRIPAFRRLLQEALPAARLHDEVDPMTAVALGAAIYANSPPEIARICPYGYAVLDEADEPLEVIAPGTEVPTPEYGHFAVRTETRYAAQTIYRLTLLAFTSPQPGQKTYHDAQRLFARGMPPTAAATRVDVELWLDEHKTVRASCHIEGRQEARPLEGREEGPEELFNRLLGKTLEAEALLEANRADTKGLIASLRPAVELALAAQGSRDREQAELALAQLRDLRDQVAAKQESLAGADLSDEQRIKQRVLGWVSFYEQNLLPRFWDSIPPARRDEAVESLRAVRVMLQTGAPAEAAELKLLTMRENLFQEDIGPMLKAWYWATLLGVPERLAEALREVAKQAQVQHKRGDLNAYRLSVDRLQDLLAEAQALWKTWRETGALVDALPDLVVVKGREERGA
jgi:actin-like ATPase involved in cell morphogenesis